MPAMQPTSECESFVEWTPSGRCVCAHALLQGDMFHSCACVVLSCALTVCAASPATPSPSPSPSPSPANDTAAGSGLALIVGLPTGFGLAFLAFGGCFLWLICSSWLERQGDAGYTSGTMPTNMAQSGVASSASRGARPENKAAYLSSTAESAAAAGQTP